MRRLATCILITAINFWQSSVDAFPGVRQHRNVYELPNDAISRKPYEETPSVHEIEFELFRFLQGDFSLSLSMSMSMPSPGSGGSTPPSTGGAPTPAPFSGQVPTSGSAQPALPPTNPAELPTAAPVSIPTSGSIPTLAPLSQPAVSPTLAPVSTPTSGSQPVGPPTSAVPTLPTGEGVIPSAAPVSAPTSGSQPVAPPTPAVPTPPTGEGVIPSAAPVSAPTSGSQPVAPPTPAVPTPPTGEGVIPSAAPVSAPTSGSQPVAPPTPAVPTPPTGEGVIPSAAPVSAPTSGSQPVGPPTPAAPTPPTGEGEIPGSEDTSIGCAEADSESTFVTFTYEMETMSNTTETNVQRNLEISLNEALASKLLECPDVRSRRLQQQDSDVGTVEFDYLPKDMAAEDPKCSLLDPASTNACYKLEGVMKVSYKQGSVLDIVEYVVRSTTKSFLNSADPEVPGLVRATYVGPDITTPPGIKDDDKKPPSGEPIDSSTLSNKNILIMSLCSVGFVVAVGLATYFRVRNSSRQDEATSVPYVATLENESSVEESHQSASCDDNGNDSISPLSAMMPNAYRLDHESPANSVHASETGTVPESDVSDGQSSGILLSEGYSTGEESDAEFPFFESLYVTPVAPVLGARPRMNEEVENAV